MTSKLCKLPNATTGYSPAETLSKEANLLRTAARYKVDVSKIATGVTAEVSAKRRPAGAKSRPVSSRRVHRTAKIR